MTRSQTSTRAEFLLSVADLHTHFELDAGTLRAVDGVSFELKPGQTLGIVGESGCGKTVLSRTVMRLNLGDNVSTSGTIKFAGRNLLNLPTKEMNEIWGREIAMVFQDPMTSLNPVVKTIAISRPQISFISLVGRNRIASKRSHT